MSYIVRLCCNPVLSGKDTLEYAQSQIDIKYLKRRKELVAINLTLQEFQSSYNHGREKEKKTQKVGQRS